MLLSSYRRVSYHSADILVQFSCWSFSYHGHLLFLLLSSVTYPTFCLYLSCFHISHVFPFWYFLWSSSFCDLLSTAKQFKTLNKSHNISFVLWCVYTYGSRYMIVAKATLAASLLFVRRCAYITSLRENTYKIVEPLVRLLQLP